MQFNIFNAYVYTCSKQPLPNVVLEPPPPKNNFSNDGSFFENFKKITDAAKKAEPPVEIKPQTTEEQTQQEEIEKLIDEKYIKLKFNNT